MAQENFHFIRIIESEKELGYWLKALDLQIRKVKTAQQAKWLAQGHTLTSGKTCIKTQVWITKSQADLV